VYSGLVELWCVGYVTKTVENRHHVLTMMDRSFHVRYLFFLSLVCRIISDTKISFLKVVSWYLAYGRDFCFVKVCRRLDDKLMSLQISSCFLLKLVSQRTEEIILIFGLLAINAKPMQSDKIWSN
jgi:hypothetical protein